MVKKRGHQRGTSHSKKKYDKFYHRNYYAEDLRDNRYRQRVLEGATQPPPSKTEMLEELEETVCGTQD